MISFAFRTLRPVMHKIVLGLCFCLVFTPSVLAQTVPDSLRKDRLLLVSLTGGTAYAAGMTGLYYLWYKNYEQTRFQTFNDNNEWLQIDKLGHAYTAWVVSDVVYKSYRFTGLNKRTSMWIGAGSAWAFLATIELFDAHSAKWGFSWGDMAANTAGTALFVGQELLWDEQKVKLKFSYWPSQYAQHRQDALGASWSERILKDYNGQSYWLSIPMQLALGDKVPAWLCLSFGYSGRGMLGGPDNPLIHNGVVLPVFERERQFLFSLDVDLSKIKTRSKALKTVFNAFNVLKIPAPALEVRQNGTTRMHGLYW